MNTIKIGVIGLGYVGLPLATLFATRYPVIGYDNKEQRVIALRTGTDTTLAVAPELLKAVLQPDAQQQKGLYCTNNPEELGGCTFYIVTVPTPVDSANRPVLGYLVSASETIGKILKKGAIVIYESTVYPGVTEEECVPVLQKHSGLQYNKDFFVGYSPERINPGDLERTIDKIVKVTSGSTPEIANKINALYASVITAGTHLAPSIRVAEAAKVIENSQRDINIAFVNELAKIFNLMGIDTQAVLAAAATKWNFLPFTPGLVGGHCIGVDPYYLAQKAQQYGYHPEIILAGRRMNDSMGHYVAAEVVKLMVQKDIKVKGAAVLVLGITFKENCPDVRNTKVVDAVLQLQSYGAMVDIHDPWASTEEVWQEYQLQNCATLPDKTYDAVVHAVAHKEFGSLDLKAILSVPSILYDVKGVLSCEVDGRL